MVENWWTQYEHLQKRYRPYTVANLNVIKLIILQISVNAKNPYIGDDTCFELSR
jgi:hypothetical protein